MNLFQEGANLVRTSTSKELIAASIGTALAYWAFRTKWPIGRLVGLASAGFAASKLAVAAGVGPALREIRETIEVNARPNCVFDVLARFEDYPKFMKSVLEVRQAGPRTWGWVTRGPLGGRVEWEMEASFDNSRQYLDWRSVTKSVSAAAECRLERLGESRTRVMVVVQQPRATGPLAAVARQLTFSDLSRCVRRGLWELKKLVESSSV